MDNKINYQIPEEVIVQLNEKVASIEELLKPYLIALTPRERQCLPKMSDGTSPFVEKCLDYTKAEPQFAPPFMAKDGFADDMDVWGKLTGVFRPLKQVVDSLDDTVMEAGAESYVAALSYYNSVKYAARLDIPKAKTIYDDLKNRFEHRSDK